MEKYPKRPCFISYSRKRQLWILIPICLFLLICNGGIIASPCILFFWIIYSANETEKEWREACDKGYASIYSSDKYLKSQGFIESHMRGITEINNNIKEDNINIDEKKKELERLIILYYHDNNNNNIYDDNAKKMCNLHREIMKYYGAENYVAFGDFECLYHIIKKGGDIYKTKMIGNRIFVDKDYIKSFMEDKYE